MCQYQDHSFRMVWFQPERSCLKRKVCVFEALALTKTMRSTMGWRMMDAVDVQEYVEQSFKHSCWSLMWFHLMTFNSELGMCALISKMIGLIHSFIWWNNWSSRITSLYWSTWKARRGGQPGWSGWLWILSLIHACTVYIYIYSTHSIVNNIQLDHIPQGEQRQLCKSAAILEIRGWNFSL